MKVSINSFDQSLKRGIELTLIIVLIFNSVQITADKVD